MIRPLREFQRLLSGAEQAVAGDPVAERLASALLQFGSPGLAAPEDVAVLVRQVLLRDGAPRAAELRVPRAAPWPDEHLWGRFGCEAQLAGPINFIVRAKAWRPSWLDEGAERALEAAFRQVPRSDDRSVPADPTVTLLTGHKRYAGPGQREAVRAAFLATAGSTVLVNLPTGAGKTLVFQVPALTWARDGGLTLVIVPTVALARDQAERFAAFSRVDGRAGVSFAYFGGLEPAAKTELRKAIANGTQPILFTSPEAAFGALRSVLFDAASRGQLRYFVVDEAHIIAQWGQQFRPEFQSLAGLRDALLAKCPPHARFRTLLLTATLTQETYNTLRQVFGSGDLQLVSEAALRPEPAFLISAAETEEQRSNRVSEALRFLPRPVLLYATERADADALHQRLQREGFRRLRLVRGGDMGGDAGEEILRGWKAREVDVVVATSAFGLGVDQSDVRAVVHACLPETMDRYYQEVGRGGRDGAACIALLLSAPGDVEKANRIGEERLLSIDRAFERWTAMWTSRRRLDSRFHILSLDGLPPGLTQSSKLNASWNLRTLVLMSRARILSFGAQSPPSLEPSPGEAPADYDIRRRIALDRFYREVVVEVSDSRHSDVTHWASAVRAVRDTLKTADQDDLRAVRELRHLKRPINEIFRDVYTLPELTVRPPPMRGSCPVTRTVGADRPVAGDPEIVTLDRITDFVDPRLRGFAGRFVDDSNRCWIAFERGEDSRRRAQWRDELHGMLRRLAAMGVVEFAIPGSFHSDADWQQLASHSPARFVVRSDAATRDPPHVRTLPAVRFTLLDDEATSADVVASVMTVSRPLHLIAMPRLTVDPLVPTRGLFAMHRHAQWPDFVTELSL